MPSPLVSPVPIPSLSPVLIEQRQFVPVVAGWSGPCKGERGRRVERTPSRDAARLEEGESQETSSESQSQRKLGPSTIAAVPLSGGRSGGAPAALLPELLRGISRPEDIAFAVDTFASCLEASVCRRGRATPFGSRSLTSGDDVSGWGEESGASPCHTSGDARGRLLLPVEVLHAIREANGICARECDSSNSADYGYGYRGDDVEGRGAEGRVMRLWGLDETGEGVQVVVRYGESRDGRGSKVRLRSLSIYAIYSGHTYLVRGYYPIMWGT